MKWPQKKDNKDLVFSLREFSWFSWLHDHQDTSQQHSNPAQFQQVSYRQICCKDPCYRYFHSRRRYHTFGRLFLPALGRSCLLCTSCTCNWKVSWPQLRWKEVPWFQRKRSPRLDNHMPCQPAGSDQYSLWYPQAGRWRVYSFCRYCTLRLPREAPTIAGHCWSLQTWVDAIRK